jgi:hypothetical protein
MKIFQKGILQTRARRAHDETEGALHPLTLHPGPAETNDYLDEYDNSGASPEFMEAMADLVIPLQIADHSFMLVIDCAEEICKDPDQAEMLGGYEPLARHVINSLMSVMNISPEESLNHMLMTCVQQKVKGLNDKNARTTASLIIHMKMTASQYLADVVSLGLANGALHVDHSDLHQALIDAGHTNWSQLLDHVVPTDRTDWAGYLGAGRHSIWAKILRGHVQAP